MKHLVGLSIIIILFFSCSQTGKGSDSETAALKPVAELTYVEIWEILLANNDSKGMDVHGEEFGTEAMNEVIEIMTGECTQQGCGYMNQIQNTSDKIMSIIVKFSFDLPGNPTKEMMRAYDIAPMEKVNIGCTNICYDNQSYPVKAEVISAGYNS